jgi:hypothetical protein
MAKLSRDLGWSRSALYRLQKSVNSFREEWEGYGTDRADLEPAQPPDRSGTNGELLAGRGSVESQGLTEHDRTLLEHFRSDLGHYMRAHSLATTDRQTGQSSSSQFPEEIPPTPKSPDQESLGLKATKGPKRPKWVPAKVPVETFQAAVLRCLAAITLRDVDPKRCATAAKSVVGLWKVLEMPDIEEFADDLCLVAKAAHECPHQLFARDIRGEGWADGSNRAKSVDTICRRGKFYDRLNAARDWLDNTPGSATSAAVIESRVDQYRAKIIRDRPDFSRLPDGVREERQGSWERLSENKISQYREWLEEPAQ